MNAARYLHHSCESAWDASGQTAEEYVAIIFSNHDFDIQRLADERVAMTPLLESAPTRHRVHISLDCM
jgi:hypothetical protein